MTAVLKNEQYWEKKHPKCEQLYNGRPLPNGKPYQMDVRSFIWKDDYVLKALIKKEGLGSKDLCEAVLNVQQWVVDNIVYTEDTTLGVPEYWMFPVETAVMRTGDCEDGSVLIASLILNIILPKDYWRVRVAAGMVQPAPTAPEGGHGYCCLCRPEDNEWVALDWCFFADQFVKVKNKVLLRKNARYLNTWFSFNIDHAWSHTTFDMRGRLRKKT